MKVTGPEPRADLIFDIGMHRALDTSFYLNKGFNVVAIEANPQFIEAARRSLSKEIGGGRLTLIERAFWNSDDDTISFYLNSVKDDWSSAFKTWAEKGGHASEEITVKTISLGKLFETYGAPYYIKCDIEGADELFVRQLLAGSHRPSFVSIEAVSLDLLALLFAAGYDRFQVVNQALNGFAVAPQPPREGKFVAAQFNGHMSGLFGRELNPKRWVPFEVAAESYLDFRRLKRRDELLAHGWLDFHATFAHVLGNVPGRPT